MLTSRKCPPLGAPGQIALAKIDTSRAIKSVPDPGEISGVLIHVRRIFLRSRIPDKGLTSPRHPVEIRARSHQHHESHRRGRNRRYAIPGSSGDLGHIDPPQTSSAIGPRGKCPPPAPPLLPDLAGLVWVVLFLRQQASIHMHNPRRAATPTRTRKKIPKTSGP